MNKKTILKSAVNNYMEQAIKETGKSLVAILVIIIFILMLATASMTIIYGNNSIINKEKKSDAYITPTGIVGEIPKEPGADIIEYPTPQESTKQSDAEDLLSYMKKEGTSSQNLKMGLMNSYLMRFSNRVIYDSSYSYVMNQESPWEILKNHTEIIEKDPQPMEGYEEYENIKNDYKAWLTLFDSPIDYPVMQGEDNLHYTCHNLYGKDGLAGTIFLDKDNSQDLSNSYNVIYGHDLYNRAMLGSLEYYREKDYYNSHRTGMIVSDNNIYDLTAFAVVETSAYENQIYTVGSKAKSIKKYLIKKEGVNNSETKIINFDKSVAKSSDKIVALSTCCKGEADDRLVVFFKMTARNL